MDGSQIHGTASLSVKVIPEKASTELVRLLAASPLNSLNQILGLDADLHLVGGCVRKTLLSEPITDFDLATKLPPEEVALRLESAGVRVIPTGLKHGTVTALIDEIPIELTTFRKPGPHHANNYSDNISEDLSGRDFTINSIAFSFKTAQFIDPFHGLKDLSQGILRAVGDARARFSEDPLRLLRLIRFGPAEGRIVEAVTEQAARELVTKIQGVSAERIRVELERIILSNHPRKAFDFMLQLGLLNEVLPELMPSVEFPQNDWHYEDVFQHTLTVLSRCRPDKHLRWAALFHDIAKPHTLSVDEEGRRHFYNHEKIGTEICHHVMERLRFSNEETKTVTTLVAQHMRPIQVGPQGIRRIIRDLGPLFDLWLEFKKADCPPLVSSEQVAAEFKAFENLLLAERTRVEETLRRKLSISGHDLMELGVKPGPKMGAIIAQLEEVVLDNPELNTRENLLSRAKELIA